MRDNIYHEIADKESGDFLFFPLSLSRSFLFSIFLSLSRALPCSLFFFHSFSLSLSFFSFYFTCGVSRAAPTHRYACTSRATDRARASKSNASDTPGSRSFLRSYSHTSSFLARALSLSHSSGLSLSVYLVVSLSLLPSPLDTHSFTASFVLFFSVSLSRSLPPAYRRLPRSLPSPLLRGQGTTIFLRCYPTSPLPPLYIRHHLLLVFLLSVTQILRPSRSVFQKCSPSRSRFVLVFRSMLLRLLQFNLIRQNLSSIIETVSGKSIYGGTRSLLGDLLVGSNNISRPLLVLL